MPGEYNRATWAYQPITLSHTPSNIVAAFKSMLQQSGWKLAEWSPPNDDIFMVRSDAGLISLQANAVGTGPNVTIVASSAAITVTGMSGGNGSTKATGTINLNTNPADLDTLTLGDGSNTYVFEFDTGTTAAKGGVFFVDQPSSGDTIAIGNGTTTKTFQFGTATGGNVQVAIGAALANTITNLITAVNAQAFSITAAAGVVASLVTFVNAVAGAAGNVPITISSALGHFGVQGMSGGGTAGVTGGRIAVAVGATRLQTTDNLIAAINASGIVITASLASYRWRYNGDGPEQMCGIRIKWVAASNYVAIFTFLQTTDGLGSQVETTSAQYITIAYDNTVENDYLMFGGEDALYFECGRDGFYNNLATGMIAAFAPIPQFSGSRDLNVKWTAQGLVMDLFGPIKWAVSRDYRFVDNQGANKNYTGTLCPMAARGSLNVRSVSPTDQPRYFIAPRDNIMSLMATGYSASDINTQHLLSTFGLVYSPFDDRYKISPFWMLQDSAGAVLCGVLSASAVDNNVAPDVGYAKLVECRFYRQVLRLAAVDPSVLPFANITDYVTGTIYRIAQIPDSGRATNIAVEYPASAITIPTTPT